MKNFLTTKQVAELNEKKWDVNPNGFYLDLYRDEFDEDVWEQMCDQADVTYDIDKLVILCFGTITNE